MNDVEVVQIGNGLTVDGDFSNSIDCIVYNVFTTRTFLTQAQIYEEDGEVTHDTDI